MKRFSEQFHKQATTVKLRAAEKRDLEDRLRSYMEYHPLPTELRRVAKSPTTPAAEKLPAEPFTTISLPFRAIFKGAAVFALLLLVVIPFAAERAVPGDALYAVKQVNENLRSTLIFDSYQKVEWETERLNRRIAEARLLANEGKLTEEVEAEVAEAVRTHTENAKKQIEALREVDADEATMASIALDTTLEVQSASLRGQEEEGGEGQVLTEAVRPTDLLADAIDASRDPADQANATGSLPAYPKLMARVEQNTTRIYELRSALTEVTSEELADIDRRMEDLARAVQEAIDLATVDEVGARTALLDVLQRTQKLIVMMTELEVVATVDIESLVPMVLTEEEQVAELQKRQAQIEADVLIIETSLPELGDEAISGKVIPALEEIALLAERAASTSVTYPEALSLLADAQALAADSLKMLEGAGALVVPELVSPLPEAATASGTATSVPALPNASATSGVEQIEESPEEAIDLEADLEGEETVSEEGAGENGAEEPELLPEEDEDPMPIDEVLPEDATVSE